jgi:hypothetical protein
MATFTHQLQKEYRETFIQEEGRIVSSPGGFPFFSYLLRRAGSKEAGMLKDEIDEAKRTVTTDTVQITIGEVANMYA